MFWLAFILFLRAVLFSSGGRRRVVAIITNECPRFWAACLPASAAHAHLKRPFFLSSPSVTSGVSGGTEMQRRWLNCAAVFLAATAVHTTQREMHGKPTQSHKVRTQHSRRWWTQSKARHLTAMPHDECKSRPHFPAYNEDVDRPMLVPAGATCFNCEKPIDDRDANSYVWIPAGNATVPTTQGYFFHFKCFKCWKCKYRLIHNKFYSKDGKAWCVACALGRDIRVPTRRWHTSYVNTHRTGSRMSGHFFPRHQHQMAFLLDPNE